MLKTINQIILFICLSLAIFIGYELYNLYQYSQDPVLLTPFELLESKNSLPQYIALNSGLVDYSQIAHKIPTNLFEEEDEISSHINYAFYPLITENNPRYHELLDLAQDSNRANAPPSSEDDFKHTRIIVRDHSIKSTQALPRGVNLLFVPFAELYSTARELPFGDQHFLCDAYNWPDLDNLIVLDLYKPHHTKAWIFIPSILFLFLTILFFILSNKQTKREALENDEFTQTIIPTKQRLYGNGVGNPFKK